jgi:phospholipase/carboxylesterase
VFLHGAGSTPEVFVPVAIAWQLKFPGATAAIVEGLRPASLQGGRDWFDARGVAADRAGRIDAASRELAERLRAVQQDTGVSPADTVVVGFSQGATMALALARLRPSPVAIAVSYAGQLARPIAPGEHLHPTVHLLHGELDTVVSPVHAGRAFRGLQATGSDVTLDIVEDESHSIGQAMINIGTTRVLQTLFRGRTPRGRSTGVLH